MIRRVLISVYDKSGVVDLATRLCDLGAEIVSTGQTAATLRSAGLDVLHVSDVSGFPEVLDGRVKTLVPQIHGGILARRDSEMHLSEVSNLGIELIDMVVVNLYPFAEVCSRGGSYEECIENIDVGGPTMIRAAAKNHRDVLVVVNPDRYGQVLEAIESGEVRMNMRRELAWEAFAHLSCYDALIADYLASQDRNAFPEELCLRYDLMNELRYGENPHQEAAFYVHPLAKGPSLGRARLIAGKPLSYNNINDADAAFGLVRQFSAPTAVAVKHATPCGVGSAPSVDVAYQLAHDGDPVSIFGGVVAVNRPVCADTARQMVGTFLEVIIAPSFAKEALDILAAKPSIRLLEVPDWPAGGRWIGEREFDVKSVAGGMLVQRSDTVAVDESTWQVVAGPRLSPHVRDDLVFAWTVARYVKSNGIVVARNGQTLGICGGQTNRIDAARMAIERSGEESRGAILASDGFFPFPDVIDVAHQAGIIAIIQPGGSVKDSESIDRAEQYGITMVFTGIRHFRH